MDETAERSFVESETGGVIKAAEARAAGGANTLRIEREGIKERGIANRAKIVSFERGRGGEARIADGNACPAGECHFANPAISGKKCGKNSVGDFVDACVDKTTEKGGCSRSRYRATREGAPP